MKVLCKALALILIATLALSLAACKDVQHFSEEFVLEELDDVVRRIKDHKHIHTYDMIPGMTETEFAPVEKAIHNVFHETGEYTITHVKTENFTDDDENNVYVVEYKISEKSDSSLFVYVSVTYVDTHDTLYRVDLVESIEDAG